MRAILRRRHPAIAYLEHVRIIPMPRPRVGINLGFSIDDVQHLIRTAVARTPLLLARPPILDIVRGAPQISSYFCAPQPWQMFAPLADAQHDRPPRGVEGGPHV